MTTPKVCCGRRGFLNLLVGPRFLFATCAGLSFQSPSAAHVRTTLEKRASVLDGALRRNPSSIKLRIAQLQLAEQLQEHDSVDSLWKKAIEKCDGTQCTTPLRSISIL